MRILVVDNQPRARKSMRVLLSVWYPDSDFEEASDGLMAIRLAEEFQPDIILMDARMPGMDGLAATKQIMAKGSKVKIVVLSMYLDIPLKALAAGADAFVSKSDPPDILRKILVEVIEGGFYEKNSLC